MAVGIKPDVWHFSPMYHMPRDCRLFWSVLASYASLAGKVRYVGGGHSFGLLDYTPLEEAMLIASLRAAGICEPGEDHLGPFELLLHRGTMWSAKRVTERGTDPHKDDRYQHLYGDPCAYCGGRSQALDHIVPWAGGGRDENGMNLTGACQRCNSKKHAKPLLTFLLDRRNI